MALTKWTYYRTEGTTKEDDATITIPANVGEYLRCDTQQSDLMSVYFTGNIGTPRADDRFIGGFVEETDEGQIVLGILLTAGNAVVLYSKKAGQVQYLQHTDITVTSGSYSIYLKKTDGGVSVGFGCGSVDAEKNILTIQDALWPSTAHWIIGNYPISDYPFSWELKGTFKSVVGSQAIRESKEGNLLVWNGLGETQINTQVIPSGSLLPKETTLIPGSVTVDKGYYNADGTNIIKFTSPVTKTLTESANQAEWKNNVFITLDQQDQSSFVVHNDWSPLQGDYKASKKLETTSIYLDPSLSYILGTEPTGINYTVTPQTPGGTYELKYLTLNGSVSYDETTGKLSGFSTSNYATSSSGITFGSSFDLIFNVTVANASTQQTLFYGQNDSGLLFTDGKIASWFGDNILGKTSVVNGNTYWIRLVWSGTLYTAYSLLDDGTYTLATLPELSSWTQEFTYSSSSNIFSSGYWVGYHSQATSQYARSTFNMGKAQMTTNGVTYRYANGDANDGSVSFTQGWLYNSMQNRTYQNKDTSPVSVEQLKSNNETSSMVGFKNNLALRFDKSSDVSLPVIFSTATTTHYNFNQDIYLDNTKTKLLGTTAVSESWVVEPNYTVVGSPTVSDNGDATGFSDSNFLTIPNPFTPTMNRFTLITSFTTTNNTVSNSGIFDSPSGNTNIRLTITDTGKLHFRISTNGEQTYQVDMTGKTTIENNKKYWAKVDYDNSRNYSIYLSEDGHVWNQEAFAIITDRPYYTSGIQNVIGDNIASGSYFEGTLHLADWSITVDGFKVWEYLKKPYSINTGTSATDTGSITYTAGYKYIDETNGSFFIQTNATKTLDELVDPSSRTEHMMLVLGIKQDGTTDFFLSGGGLLPPDYTYTEDIADVYLDRTLSYIYGTTADPRKKLTVQVTPDTYGIRLEELNPLPPPNWAYGTGTATLAVAAGATVSGSIHNVETNPNTYMFEEVVNEDIIKTYEMATITINAVPDTALIEITYGPDDQPSFNHGMGTITCPLPVGTQIQWTVSADEYVSQSGEETVTEDITKNITLETEPVTFIINPTPSDATVKINNVVQNSVEVEKGSTVTWSVEKTGYVTQSGEEVVNEDTTKTITLVEEAPAERTEPTTPTDTFYAWINQDNPHGNNWFTLTESPIGEDYLYMSDATANNNYPLGVVSSTGAADRTLNATSIQATIQDGNLVFGTTGTVYTRTPSSDGEYTLFHTWVDDTLYNTYLTLKTIPVDGDVVYGYNTGTGELTNAGTIGNQWDYVEGAGTINHVSGAPTGEGMVEPFTYIWIRSTTIPSS